MKLILNTQSARRVVLRRYPDGAVQPADFSVEAQEVPSVGDGEFLVRNLYVSVDPMLRLFVDPKPLDGMMPPMPLGTAIPGAAVGEIVESHNAAYAVGDFVEGRFGWQNFAVSNGAGVNRVSPKLGGPENALGIGGLPGFTAFVGLQAAGGVKPGQTILVSGAAGAVGSMVGAFVKARGGRVVGIAGGEAKKRYLTETIGYDAAADRLSPDFHLQLRDALPGGVDVYFDNVGGKLLAEITPYMKRGGLVLISGLMAQYQDTPDTTGKDNLSAVLRAVMFKGIHIHGFSQMGQDALRPAFEEEIGALLASGAIRSELHIEQGIDRLPQAMVNLFEKSVTGKVIVRVDTEAAVASEKTS